MSFQLYLHNIGKSDPQIQNIKKTKGITNIELDKIIKSNEDVNKIENDLDYNLRHKYTSGYNIFDTYRFNKGEKVKSFYKYQREYLEKNINKLHKYQMTGFTSDSLSCISFININIIHFPDIIAPNITIISIVNCNLTNFPKIDCPNLAELDLSFNGITSIPEDVSLPRLKICNVKNNKIEGKLPERMFGNTIEIVSIANNEITEIPNVDYYNTVYFNVSNNMLSKLPTDINLYNATFFDCSNNPIEEIPENINLYNVTELNISQTNITSLPETINLYNVRSMNLSNNSLNKLPENLNLPKLERLNCSYNDLTHLPSNMNCSSIFNFNCEGNPITGLPDYILNWENLEDIQVDDYYDLELSVPLRRFLDRFYEILNIYDDEQNVHDPTIQKTARESISKLINRTDICKYDKDKLIEIIKEDDIIKNKEQVLKDCELTELYSELQITYPEVLWYVLQTIKKDFDEETQKEIKRIFDEDVDEGKDKCLTGKINRAVNSLSGFSDNVNINISENEQMGNIVIKVKKKHGDNYDVDKVKEEVYAEFKERNFSEENIQIFIDNIE